MENDTPLHGVLIGCGYISHRQLQAWQRVENVEIVAVCDLDETLAHSRAKEFAIAHVYTDYRRMFDEQTPDFVDIATRPATHLELVRSAVERKIAVLCQKPLADTLPECRKIVDVCRGANVPLMVNENGRHQPWFRQAKRLLERGELGDPFYARFATRNRSSLPTPHFGGQPYFVDMPRLMVYEMDIHFLDTARYLFGEAESVYARLHQVSPHIAGEDVAMLVVNFPDLTCLVDSSWASVVPVDEQRGERVTWGPFQVEGSGGTLTLAQNGTMTLHTDGRQRVWTFPADSILQSFADTQRHFVECLRSGKETETSGDETLKTMSLVFGAYQSALEGEVVPVGAVK